MKKLLLIAFILISSSLIASQIDLLYPNRTSTSNNSIEGNIWGAMIIGGGLGYLVYQNCDNPTNLAINTVLLGGYGLSAVQNEKERHVGSSALSLMVLYDGFFASGKDRDTVFWTNVGLYILGYIWGEFSYVR